MNSQWSDFVGWPSKQLYLIKFETYKKKELVNLLKYNEFKIRIIQDELKGHIRERHEVLNKLKELNA